jgi:O-antigen/teichoic acid export membrane protein
MITVSQTLLDYIWRALQIGSKQGIVFVTFLICANVLTPFDFGIYNYILAWMAFLILFCDFGISTATSKLVAEYNLVNKDRVSLVMFNASIILAGLSLLSLILILLFRELLSPEISVYILYASPLVLLIPLSSLYDGVYRGLQRFKQLSIISILSGIVSLPIVYFLTTKYGIHGALIAQSAFFLIYVLLLTIGYRENIKLNFSREVISELSVYSFYVGFATIGYFLFSRIDILILGHFGFITEIATYEVLNKIFGILLIPVQIFAQVIAPHFTHLYTSGNYQKVTYLFKKYALLFSVAAILFTALSLFGIPYLIDMFFPEYNNPTLYTFLLPVVLIYSLAVYSSVLHAGIIVATGHAKLMTILNLFLAGANFVLSLLFLKWFGYIGVVYASLMLNLVGTIILQIVYYRKISKLIYD